MSQYSAREEELSSVREDFEDGLAAFFSGGSPEQKHRETSYGPTVEEIHAENEAWFDSCIAAIEADDDLPEHPRAPSSDLALSVEHSESLCAVSYSQPDHLSPYDRAFIKVRELEAKLESATGPVRAQLLERLSVAQDELKRELARDLDEDWRALRRIDRWRAEEGRDDYNQSRRRVRPHANEVTPQADLEAMDDREKAQHRKDQKADSKFRTRKAAEGWTAEEIQNGLTRLRDKREAKRGA